METHCSNRQKITLYNIIKLLYHFQLVDNCNDVEHSVNVRLLKPMDFKLKLVEENNPNSDVLVEEENSSGDKQARKSSEDA